MLDDKDVKEVTIKVFDDNSDSVPATLEDYEVHVCVEEGRLFCCRQEYMYIIPCLFGREASPLFSSKDG